MQTIMARVTSGRLHIALIIQWSEGGNSMKWKSLRIAPSHDLR